MVDVDGIILISGKETCLFAYYAPAPGIIIVGPGALKIFLKQC